MARPPSPMKWRPEDTEAAVHAQWQKETHLGRRTRLHALWLLHKEWHPAEVAEALDVGERTVQRWCDWYRQGGIKLVLARCQGNKSNHSRLSVEQKAKLRTELASGRFRTGAEIRAWVKQEFGVEYRPKSIYTVTQRLKSHPKVPRPRHIQADVAQQQAWRAHVLKETLAAAGVTQGMVVAYGDEMRVGLHGKVRRRWGVVGIKVIQRVQITYEWVYLYAFVEIMSGTIWWAWADGMKEGDLLGVLRAVGQQTPINAVVWDGAKSHSGELTREVAAEHQLKLVTLPPYSPELNPVERLFEAIRGAIEGEVYSDLAAKQAAVETLLGQWEAHPAVVQQLTGFGSIRRAFAQLPEAS